MCCGSLPPLAPSWMWGINRAFAWCESPSAWLHPTWRHGTGVWFWFHEGVICRQVPGWQLPLRWWHLPSLLTSAWRLEEPVVMLMVYIPSSLGWDTLSCPPSLGYYAPHSALWSIYSGEFLLLLFLAAYFFIYLHKSRKGQFHYGFTSILFYIFNPLGFTDTSFTSLLLLTWFINILFSFTWVEAHQHVFPILGFSPPRAFFYGL